MDKVFPCIFLAKELKVENMCYSTWTSLYTSKALEAC